MRRVLLCAASLCLLAACQTVQTTQPGVVGVDRAQSMLISSAEVNASAEKAYQQQVGGAAKKGQVNQDPAQVARVRRIEQHQLVMNDRLQSRHDVVGLGAELLEQGSPSALAESVRPRERKAVAGKPAGVVDRP